MSKEPMAVKEASARYSVSVANAQGVPPGYKHTEVGVIPDEWEVAAIGDLNPFVTSGSRGWAAYYSDRGSPFIRITNLSRESIYLDLGDLKFVDLPPDVSEGTRTRLQDDDVLISITADIGIVGYVSANVPKPAYINQHIALVRFDPSKTNSKFVSYFLAAENPQKLFRASTDIGAKAGMSLITVQKIRLALPLLPEQRAIAAALADVDALIAALDKLIAKKRAIKTATMQQLLTGKQRLPGFGEGKGYRQTEVGQVPEEWEIKELWQVTQSNRPISYGIVQTGRNVLNGVKCIRVVDISNGEIDADDLITTSQEISKSYKRTILQPGDLVIALRGKIGELAIVTNELEGANLTRGVALIALTDSYDSRYFRQYLSSPISKSILEKNLNGSALQELPIATLRKIPVPCPQIEEQRAIATVLSGMDAEIAALEARRNKTQAIKQGMMQELLTGKTRLV